MEALNDELQSQQAKAMASYKEQFLSSFRSQRQEAAEEVWKLESHARRKLREDLQWQTDDLQRASTALEEAAAKEESVRSEYDTVVFDIRQNHIRGLRQLEIEQSIVAFKQKLLSRVNSDVLARAAKARSSGICDPETDELTLQRWKEAVDDLEALLSGQRQVYCFYADEACKIVRENDFKELVHARESRLNQAALIKSLERAEEQGEDDVQNKRLAFDTNEIQRVIWNVLAFDPFGESKRGSRAGGNEPLGAKPEPNIEEEVNLLRQQFRCRRKRHLDYCIAQRDLVEGSARSALAALQDKTIQGLSDTTSSIGDLRKGSAELDSTGASERFLATIKECQEKLNEELAELEREQEAADERDRRELETAKAVRQKEHEETMRQLVEEHQRKLIVAEDDMKDLLLKEHESAMRELGSALQAEQKDQEEEAQRKLQERQQRLQQKRQEAEEKKQKALELAKAELDAQLAAEAEQMKDKLEREEIQRLAHETTDTAAVIELLTRRHEKETCSLLQELSLKKAEEMSALTEQFWDSKGGRFCEGRPNDVQELYKAELQECLLVRAQEADNNITLRLQDLQKRHADEQAGILKQMENRSRMKMENEALQLSEQEQYERLKREAEAAAEQEVQALEQRMMEQQEQLIKEMEDKRNAYNRLLGQLKHREEAAEKRKHLKLAHQERLQQGKGKEDGLKRLMSQMEKDRQLLEAALVLEAERQHKIARRGVLLRNAERSQRLYDKRLLEKQRFLVQQNEIRRRALELNHARAGVRIQRNLVETLNQKETEKRMAFTKKLEEEHHWAPIWRQIFEEEQTAGTFDSCEPDEEHVTFGGQFATSLLHTERMLLSETSYMRKLIGGFQELSDVLALIKSAPTLEQSPKRKGTSGNTMSEGSAPSGSDSEESSETGEGTAESGSSSSDDEEASGSALSSASPSSSNSSGSGSEESGSDSSSSTGSDSRSGDSESDDPATSEEESD